MNAPILYIVVPCFNEEEVLVCSNNELMKCLQMMIEIKQISTSSRILYVNDGSSDSTWEIICSLHKEYSPLINGVRLAKNSGHQNALLAGLFAAKENADIMISIDADLQDDIAVIPEMVKKYNEGSDIVYGVRKARSTDTFFKRFTAESFYKILNSLSGGGVIQNHADYRLMSKRAINQLFQYKERNLYLRGIVTQIGYKSDYVFYDRKKRLAGESKYPLKKMINFAIDGITSFSTKPLIFVSWTGIFFLLLSVCAIIYAISSKVGGNVVPGWTSILISIWFVGGCVLLGLGIVGLYIGKIYVEVKERPRYNIETVLK